MIARECLTMNRANHVELEGTVQGVPWLSYGRGQRGRVNFWLAVSRDLAGEGADLLQCAVEPRCGQEVLRLDREMRDGRRIRLVAQARSGIDLDQALEPQKPVVVFVAEECAFEDEELRSAHRVGLPRRVSVRGKVAAAGDVDLLPLEGEVRP